MRTSSINAIQSTVARKDDYIEHFFHPKVAFDLYAFLEATYLNPLFDSDFMQPLLPSF